MPMVTALHSGNNDKKKNTVHIQYRLKFSKYFKSTFHLNAGTRMPLIEVWLY